MNNSLVKKIEINREAVAEILKISSPAIKDNHIDYFVNYCQSMGLNPIEREIYGYTNGDNSFVMVVSYTTYLKRVMEHFEEKGIDFWYETRMFQDETTKGLVCEVVLHEEKKQDRRVECHLSEFTTNRSRWAKAPRDMLEKCTITKALRRHYPTLIANLPYAEEEMDGVKSYEKEATMKEVKSLPKMTNTKIDNIDLEKTLKELNINVI